MSKRDDAIAVEGKGRVVLLFALSTAVYFEICMSGPPTFGLGQPASPQAASSPARTGEAVVDASTPWVAASDGNLALLQTSLQTLSLPITAADENGYTLLMAAASYGQISIIEGLLALVEQQEQQQRNYINAKDQEGDTALHYASTVEVIELLISKGIDPYLCNTSGCTAVQAKRTELAEMRDDEDSDEDEMEQLQKVVDYMTSAFPPVPAQ